MWLMGLIICWFQVQILVGPPLESIASGGNLGGNHGCIWLDLRRLCIEAIHESGILAQPVDVSLCRDDLEACPICSETYTSGPAPASDDLAVPAFLQRRIQRQKPALIYNSVGGIS